MTTSLIGPLVAPWNVEQAVLGTLTAWMPHYLFDVERQNGLEHHALPRPPAPESIIGGLDFDSWTEDLLPMLIVVCNPTGQPTHNASIGYSQTYAVDVAAVVTGDDEHTARMHAGLYAAAAAGALEQRGALGGLATRTRMTGSPRVEFPDPEIRLLARGAFRLEVEVDGILSDEAGPADPTPPQDPEPPPTPRPIVTLPGVTVTGEPLTGSPES